MRQYGYILFFVCFFSYVSSAELYFNKNLENPYALQEFCLREVTRGRDSFEQGTLVKGITEYIPIEQLQLGDWIAGENGEQQVIGIKKHIRDDLICYSLTTEQHGLYISR